MKPDNPNSYILHSYLDITNDEYNNHSSYAGKHKEEILHENKIITTPDSHPNAWLKLPVPMSKEWIYDFCFQFILKGSFKKGLGLYDGKMGYALFFFHCARCLDNPWLEEYAEELLDEIYTDITFETPLYFSNGLCGIGWGIEYLVQHNFLKGYTDGILIDLDKKVMETDLRRIEDTSQETGLKGIACYVCSRLASSRPADTVLPFDSLYLEDLKEACLLLDVNMEYSWELPDILEQISSYYSNKSKNELNWHLVIKQLLCITNKGGFMYEKTR